MNEQELQVSTSRRD